MRSCFKGKACTNEIFSISLEIGANINSEPYRQPKSSVNTLDTGMELFNFRLGFPLAPAVRPKRQFVLLFHFLSHLFQKCRTEEAILLIERLIGILLAFSQILINGPITLVGSPYFGAAPAACRITHSTGRPGCTGTDSVFFNYDRFKTVFLQCISHRKAGQTSS